jgi:hypothetical protein
MDADAFLREIHRLLHAQGRVLITTPNLVSFENRLRILLGIYPIWVNYNLSGIRHIRAYAPRVLKNQLRDNSFRVIKHKGNGASSIIPQYYLHDIKLLLLAITGDIFPNLSMNIIILAQRKE